MENHDSSRSAWGWLGQIRSNWTLFTLVLVGLFILILIIFIVIGPGHGEVDVDRYLPNGKPEPWPDLPELAAIAGCYEISFSDWKPKISSGEADFMKVPPMIELTTEPLAKENAEAYLILRPAPGIAPSVHRAAYWYVTPGRTLLLLWSDRDCGLQVELGPIISGELRGYAKTFLGFHGQLQVASVTAKRIDCGEPRKQ